MGDDPVDPPHPPRRQGNTNACVCGDPIDSDSHIPRATRDQSAMANDRGWGQRVAGRCPACGSHGTLFVAAGQHITCQRRACPDPTWVADLLLPPGPNGQGQALHAVARERHRQDRTWGRQDHAPETWLAILTEEVGELAEAVLLARSGDLAGRVLGPHSDDMRAEAVQVAAVAVALVEHLDRRVTDALRNHEEDSS